MELLESWLRRRAGDAFEPFSFKEREEFARLQSAAQRLDPDPPVQHRQLFWGLAAALVFMSQDRAEPGRQDLDTLDCCRLYWNHSASPGWVRAAEGGLRHDAPKLRAARRRHALALEANGGETAQRGALWRAAAALKVARRRAWTPEAPPDAFPLQRFERLVVRMAWDRET